MMLTDSPSGRIVQPRPEERVCVIGVPGSGKSVVRRRLLSQPPIYRCVLWNPMEDYNIGEIMTVDDFESRMENFRRGSLRVTVSPSGPGNARRAAEYDRLCGLVYEVGALHFATEEIALVADPNSVPDNLDQLCIKGRHRAVSLSFYGQRFAQFPLIVRGTASEIVAFAQTDPADVKDFEKRIAPAESPVSLNELPPHHFIHWTREGGAVLCDPIPAGNFEAYSGSQAA